MKRRISKASEIIASEDMLQGTKVTLEDVKS